VNTTEDFRATKLQILPDGHFSAAALLLRYLIVYAYNLPMNPSERLTGVPEWTNEARYDIEAKAPDGACPAGLPASDARARVRAMLRALLADRFRLMMRRDEGRIHLCADGSQRRAQTKGVLRSRGRVPIGSRG
jgi:uncharacterized protein (TIGR03435 family)